MGESSVDRPPDSHSEISDLPPPSHPDFLDVLGRRGEELEPETLVYLFRECSSGGHRPGLNRVAELLVGEPQGDGTCIGGCCEHIISSTAKVFGLADRHESLAEFRQRCYSKILEKLDAGREEEPFWEERFYRALKSVALDVGQKMKADRERFVSAVEGESSEYDPPSLSSLDDRTQDHDSEIESDFDRQELLRVLRGLPLKARRAAHLHWIHGYKIESKMSDKTTVASLMGVTPRSVRTYLADARDQLREDPTVQAMIADV